MIKETIYLTHKASAELLVSYEIGRSFSGPKPEGEIVVNLTSVEAQILGHWSEILGVMTRAQVESLEAEILKEADKSGLILEF